MQKNKEKIELYIVSLWLLFLLIIVVTIDIPFCLGKSCNFIGFKSLFLRNIIPLVSLIMLICGIIGVLRFKYKVSGSVQTPIKIKKISNINYEHLTFLSTYIIPLIAFDLTEFRYFLVLLILLFSIGAIYLKTNMFFSNPTLAILGYQIYRVDAEFRTTFKKEIILISRQKLFEDDRVSYKKIDNNIYYVRRMK